MSKPANGRGAIAVIGLLVLFAGLAGGVVLWIIAAREPNSSAEAFARAAPGCTTTVTFSQAGEYYVFEELSGVAATAEGCEATTTPGQVFAFDIRPLGGQPIERVADTGVSYDLDAGEATSVARITIEAPGDYAVSVLGNDPAINAAIGDDPAAGVAQLRRGAIASVLVGVVVGGVLLWLTGWRSRKAATFPSPVDPGWGVTERDHERRTAAPASDGSEWASPTSSAPQVPVNPHLPDERRVASPSATDTDGDWAPPVESEQGDEAPAPDPPAGTAPAGGNAGANGADEMVSGSELSGGDAGAGVDDEVVDEVVSGAAVSGGDAGAGVDAEVVDEVVSGGEAGVGVDDEVVSGAAVSGGDGGASVDDEVVDEMVSGSELSGGDAGAGVDDGVVDEVVSSGEAGVGVDDEVVSGSELSGGDGGASEVDGGGEVVAGADGMDVVAGAGGVDGGATAVSGDEPGGGEVVAGADGMDVVAGAGGVDGGATAVSGDEPGGGEVVAGADGMDVVAGAGGVDGGATAVSGDEPGPGGDGPDAGEARSDVEVSGDVPSEDVAGGAGSVDEAGTAGSSAEDRPDERT